jgi:hypothetical protein
MAENEGARETGEAIVMCIVPDVCLTNGVPVPYQIIARFNTVEAQSPNVRMTSDQTMTMNGRLTRVIGDEAGTGGGIISGVNVGYCRPITHSSTVRANGFFICYHTSFYWMNCAGPDGPGNTLGRVVYVKSDECVYVGPLGEIDGDTNPPVKPEGKKEEGWLDWLGRQYGEYQQALEQGRVNTLKSWGDDLVGLARFASDLSPAGMIGAGLKDAGVNVPDWVPNTDRAAGQVANTVTGVGGFVADASPLGSAGDLLRQQGVSLPDWAPSNQRAGDEVAGAFHGVVDPYVTMVKDGDYGAALGKAQSAGEKATVEIAATVLTDGAAGEIMAGGRAVEVVGELGGKEVLEQAGKDGVKVVQSQAKELRRPYVRKWVRKAVDDAAPKAADGRFIDPNTGLPIDGKPDLGHKPGHEFWREKQAAEAKGWTQKEFNDHMNNPDYYQWEDPSSNRSHQYEMK